MYAPRDASEDGNAGKPFEETYIQARLEQLARTRLLTNIDDLFKYFTEEIRLDKPCAEWIEKASYPTLRRLLSDHQQKYKQYHVGPAQQREVGSSASDSGCFYSDRDPASPMSGVRVNSWDDLFLVPIETPNVQPVPVRARIDPECDQNLIDLEIAKSLFGTSIREGQNISVGYRYTHNDEGNNTEQIQCVVGGILDENIVLSRNFGRPRPRADTISGSSGASPPQVSMSEQDDFQQLRAHHLVVFAGALAQEDLKRKRPDNDIGSQRLTQRPKID